MRLQYSRVLYTRVHPSVLSKAVSVHAADLCLPGSVACLLRHKWRSRCCFFFQADDVIRDLTVTGVQTWLFRSPFAASPLAERKVVPQHWVWIGNTVGSVRVEGAKGDSLEVVAVKTHRRSDPGSVHIETVKVADGIAICAVWAHGGGRCVPGEDYKPSSPHRSDVAVEIG